MASRHSQLGRRLEGSTRSVRTSRHVSRAQNFVVEHDEAQSFALRAAFLHYLLEPKTKRKQWVAAPAKPAPPKEASVVQLVQEYTSGTTTSLKLPHNFSQTLLDRIGGVLRGSEALPGFNDAAVKRSFAEAYTTFSEKNFRKTIDKERKFEPLVLMFYSAATKAAQKGKTQDDDSWKLLPDRHLAMFVRLTLAILRDTGAERERPELASRLQNLEKKLLTNDQDLVGGETSGKTIEVTVPLSYDVKDMHLVQVVASIFGLSHSEAQAEINEKRSVWTEEAALKDLKAYQHRLNSDMTGALRGSDFDLDDAFAEWKKTETMDLPKMMLDILTAKPELAKSSSGPSDKPFSSRPNSVFVDDQAYGDLSRAISAAADGGPVPDVSSLARMSIGDAGSIRAVDNNIYTFIPSEPRAYFKYILQQAMTFDQIHADPDLEYQPCSKQSTELMTELCVRWRLPQASRLICILEVAARQYKDEQLTADELDDVFRYINSPLPEPKKQPHMHQCSTPLNAIPPSHWTMRDYATYQTTLTNLHDALLRDLFDLMEQCYSTKPPQTQAVLYVLENHVEQDPCFSKRKEVIEEFTESLDEKLHSRASEVYREYMEKVLPADNAEWDFLQVVKLGKAVTKLCERIRTRYKRAPEIMGVNPLSILVHRIFPSFEKDAHHIIQAILDKAHHEGLEFDMAEGFELYKELKTIRSIHEEMLPRTQPFAFNVEDLLVDFPWRLIRNADGRMEEYVDSAVKQDQFQVRTESLEDIPTDEQRHSVSIIDLFMLFNQSLDQITKLEWQNTEHLARFMTALSKSFCAGVGRYCELVDQQFAREMDRPSAEDLAMQNKTTQERLLQYARNAWTSQEKAAPFQFYPESFVKLNNIEYAMQELDKLETAMNAEGCAAELERIDGPKKKVRKPNKYTFTVKVVEAEDLKACDPNGFSDPYVVFGDEYQKRLHKTRIIYRNLNPRWDESFDITVQGPVNVIATIWDYDTFGDHDYVGRTSLKLDPVHFQDYLPREFWLDLDSQGRMLVRISMEGERDDILFHYGKAFRHLKRTERDMVRKITDKVSKTSFPVSHKWQRIANFFSLHRKSPLPSHMMRCGVSLALVASVHL